MKREYLARYRKREGPGKIAFYKENGVITKESTGHTLGNFSKVVNRVHGMIKGYYEIGLK